MKSLQDFCFTRYLWRVVCIAYAGIMHIMHMPCLWSHGYVGKLQQQRPKRRHLWMSWSCPTWSGWCNRKLCKPSATNDRWSFLKITLALRKWKNMGPWDSWQCWHLKQYENETRIFWRMRLFFFHITGSQRGDYWKCNDQRKMANRKTLRRNPGFQSLQIGMGL